MSSGGSHILSAIRGLRSGPPVNGEREELDPLRGPRGLFVFVRILRAWAPLLFPRPGAPSVTLRPSGRHATGARPRPLPQLRCRFSGSGAGAPSGQKSTVARSQRRPRCSPRLQRRVASRDGPSRSSIYFCRSSGAAVPDCGIVLKVPGVFFYSCNALTARSGTAPVLWVQRGPSASSALRASCCGGPSAHFRDHAAASPVAVSDHRSGRDPQWPELDGSLGSHLVPGAGVPAGPGWVVQV
ncbi:hypothetical protein NDU88_004765 [Pleurodeles waltl]|uniref:Uncharacterized protein n=1 Tax=Pleurodeles waltl TaxID=8319 RepID=A0AAV7M791_PLEWA|nr:hypothetical protein NDU88_004765 [Pleurodeles waltl]